MATNPLGVTPPPPPSVPDISQYISIAQQQLSPGSDDVISAIQNEGNVAKAGSNAAVNVLAGESSILTKTYSDLSKEFDIEQAQETGQAQNTGDARIGEAKAALAAGGVTNAQGSFRAPVAGAENDLQTTIAGIAEKYGAKHQDIADTLVANQQQLAEKIVDAQNSGNMAYAQTLTQVAQLKYQQQQQIVSLAQQMQAAQTQYEQNAWKDYMDEVNAQHQQATLDLMSERIAQSETTADRQYNLDVAKYQDSKSGVSFTRDEKTGGLSFTQGQNKTPISLSTYLSQTGGSWDAKGTFTPAAVDPRQVVSFLQESGNADDKGKATIIGQILGKYSEQYGGISTVNGQPDPNFDPTQLPQSVQNKLFADLRSKYPEIFAD